MINKDSDIFESARTNVFESKPSLSSNFFLSEPAANINLNEQKRRLNDYDFNLLKEEAYKDVDDDLFRLEYKISKTEEELKDIDAKIALAAEVGDSEKLIELSNLKEIAKNDYDSLIALYNNRSVSAKITDTVSGSFKSSLSSFNARIEKWSEKLLSKLPQKFKKIIEIKRSLAKLENINKSVDELMTLNIPYGENIDKYQQLSKYILKANSIHSEISRYIKKA